MPQIPAAGFVLEALGAVILASILWSFARGRRRPGVRDWALGLWALAAGLLGSIAVRRVPGLAAQTATLAVAIVFAYWSPALLILGTWCHATGRQAPLVRRRLLVALGVIGLGTTLAAPLAGTWGPMLRSGTRTLATMAAQLAAGLALLRRPSAGRAFGARLVGLTFLGGAAEEAFFFGVVVTGGASPRAVPVPDVLVEVELVLLMLLGVGLVAWLLEDERESGLRLQEALHRREAFAAMGTLVGGVAHEVRNPLFAISATLDAFAAGGRADGSFAPLLATLRAQVDRLSALMADLLEYGRPIAAELVRRPVAEVVARAVESCAPRSSRANVTVEIGGDPAGLTVLMDQARLLQAFENLVHNALDHTPGGGRVRVHVRAEERQGRRGALCEVRDSGSGFEGSDLPWVFEPFFSHRRGGTGLGLSIVRRVVEQHSGQVEASNEPAGGAVVGVWLPLEPEAPPSHGAIPLAG